MDRNKRQRKTQNSRIRGRILDRTAHRQGFDRFASSSVRDAGEAVLFEYVNGARYVVPISYINVWFMPGPEQREAPDRRVARSRCIRNGEVVRLYFTNGEDRDVLWETVLMACEPRFEHYGGLVDASRAITLEWAQRHGSFRIA